VSPVIDVLVSGSDRVRSTGGLTRVSLGALRVTAPAGAIRRSQWLQISIGSQAAAGPEGAVSIGGGPYLVSTSQGEPSRPVTVTFTYDRGLLAADQVPIVVHGIPRLHRWVYVPANVDRAARTITATVSSFSPMDVAQGASWFIGQMLGDRADPADCKGDPGPPSWAAEISMPDGRGDPITSCLTSNNNGSQAIIKLVNNRGYAQFLTLSGAPLDVKHSWFSDEIDTTLMNALYAINPSAPGSFTLGPGAQASLVIDKPAVQMADTDITVDAASDSLSPVAALLWALENTVFDQLSTPLATGNCVYGELYNALHDGGSIGGIIDQLHSCTSAALGLSGSAKEVVQKVGAVLFSLDVYQDVLDLRLGDLYAIPISFTIPGTNPTFTNPSIHLGAASFGTITDGEVAVEHLSASGGTPPYRYHFYNLYPTPPWLTLTDDGTLTISPPAGDEGSYSFYVWVGDATGAHSPFARDQVTFQTAPAAVSVSNPGAQNDPVGIPVSLQINALASDGGTLSYSADGLPDGLSIDPASGLISGTPTTMQQTQVTVTVSDSTGIQAGQATFTWLIEAGDCGTETSPPSGGDGTWQSLTLPLPCGMTTSNPSGPNPNAGWDISCPGPGSCVALAQNYSAGPDQAYAATEQNGTWSSSIMPIPSTISGTVYSSRYTQLACATTTSTCLALGDVATDNGAVDTPMIASESDGSWSTSEFQPPADPPYPGLIFQYWRGLQCPTENWCEALAVYATSPEGNAGDLGFATYTLADGVASSAWLPMPADAAEQNYYPGNDGPMSLSCPQAGQCVAVGTYLSSNDLAQSGDAVELFPASWTLSTGTWTASRAPAPEPGGGGDGADGLTDVSCASATFCTAVGQITDVGAFIDEYSGGTWSTGNIEITSGQQASGAGFVQCPAVGQCSLVAFGGSVLSGDSAADPPYYAVLGQSGLSLIGELPVPSDAYGSPWAADSDYAVEEQACASADWCVIAERYPTAAGSQADQAAFVTYANGTLSVVPAPPGASDIGSGALVCPAQNACAAIVGAPALVLAQ
jgi:Putative Ig domain